MKRLIRNSLMLKKVLLAIVVVVVIAVASAAGGYWLAQHQRSAGIKSDGNNANTVSHKKEQQLLYWYDPMAPNQHFDKPGKSPFMDMPLIAKYAELARDESSEDKASIKISDALTQNLGVRYATIEQGELNTTMQVPANVMFNERDIAIVQTKSAGFVEKVYAHAPGDVIAAGAPLLTILLPEWASAQAEYLGLKKSGDVELAQAAQERLRFLGMPEDNIRQLNNSGKVQSLYTLQAPIAGVIQSLDVRQGMTLGSGMTVARINGLATVWLEAAVPEAQAGHLKPGQAVSAVITAYPDTTFNGRISAVLPEANIQTRTLRVRMEFSNPQLRLRPGMFARVQLNTGDSAKALLVPTEAIIRTGKRDVVIMAEAGGHFRPVVVTLGAESNGKTVLLSGLKAGQKVVASGQFLIDSEASLNGVMARMNPPDDHQESAALTESGILARGVIKHIGKNEITIAHDAIADLDWPAMTMAFALDKNVRTSALKTGQKISFTLEKKGEDLVITRIEAVIKTGEAP